MTIHFRSFGAITDIVKETEWNLAEGCPAGMLKVVLKQAYPALQNIPFAIGVGSVLVNDDFVLLDGHVVALMPPFSGG